MKKILIIVLILVIILLATIVIFYFRNGNNISMNNNILEIQKDTTSNNENEISEIKEIPQSYYSKANNQGKLEEFYYDTYESKTYEQKNKPPPCKNRFRFSAKAKA